jgi:hypothetical protein
MFLTYTNDQLCYKCNIEHMFLSRGGMKLIVKHKATHMKLEPDRKYFQRWRSRTASLAIEVTV